MKPKNARRARGRTQRQFNLIYGSRLADKAATAVRPLVRGIPMRPDWDSAYWHGVSVNRLMENRSQAMGIVMNFLVANGVSPYLAKFMCTNDHESGVFDRAEWWRTEDAPRPRFCACPEPEKKGGAIKHSKYCLLTMQALVTARNTLRMP